MIFVTPSTCQTVNRSTETKKIQVGDKKAAALRANSLCIAVVVVAGRVHGKYVNLYISMQINMHFYMHRRFEVYVCECVYMCMNTR